MLQHRRHVFHKDQTKVNDPSIWIFTNKEIALMLIFIIIGSFISFLPIIPNENPLKILRTILVFTLIITISLATKKVTAPHFAIKIEHTDWKLVQWWFLKRNYFKKPLPLGLIAPFFLAIFTIGYLKPFAFFQFNSKDIPEKRILKQHGSRPSRRKEFITEEDLGYTAASGMYALLILATIGLILKSYFPIFGSELTKYSIYYGLWNLLPVGQLDGTKIFFGTTILWSFLTIIYVVSTILLIAL